MTTDCSCLTPPFSFRDYDETPIGVDTTNGRHGEVSFKTCRQCGASWLHYFVEYEAFTKSGRWYRGLMTAELQRTVTAETAVAVIASLPWYFFGGSYFESTGQRGSGPPRVAP